MNYLAAALIAVAAPLQAACPVAADLATGIRVETTGQTLTYTKASPDHVSLAILYQDDPQPYVHDLWQGILTLRVDHNSPGDPLHIAFDYAPGLTTGILPLRAGLSVPGDVTRTDLLTGYISPSGFLIETLERPDLVVGDCRYQAIPVEQTYQIGDLAFTSLSIYLPELGFTIFSGSRDPDQVTDLPPLSIAVVGAE